jgi:hypothetical protein
MVTRRGLIFCCPELNSVAAYIFVGHTDIFPNFDTGYIFVHGCLWIFYLIAEFKSTLLSWFSTYASNLYALRGWPLLDRTKLATLKQTR